MVDDGPQERVRNACHSQFEHLWRGLTGRDGLEADGMILGTDSHNEFSGFIEFRAWQGGYEVLMATRPGPRALRERDRCNLDPDFDLEASTEIRRETGWAVLGRWHSHPKGTRQLSDADLNRMVIGLETLGLERYLELVLVPGPAGGVDVEAFVLYRAGSAGSKGERRHTLRRAKVR